MGIARRAGGIQRAAVACALAISALLPAMPVVPAFARTAAATPAGVGADFRVSPADGNVYETVSAAIDPNDPSTIVAAANSWMPPNRQTSYEHTTYGSLPIGIFRTHGGGATWAPSILPPSVPATAADWPRLAIDAAGTTRAAWDTGPLWSPHPAPLLPVVSSSTDHGATWGPQVAVAPAANWPSSAVLGVDQSNSTYRNRVYASYTDSSGPGAQTPYMSSWSATPITDRIGLPRP
jgi:hypothetical protein